MSALGAGTCHEKYGENGEYLAGRAHIKRKLSRGWESVPPLGRKKFHVLPIAVPLHKPESSPTAQQSPRGKNEEGAEKVIGAEGGIIPTQVDKI